MFGLSFWEIALIMVVALVVLGPKRLPDAARTLGRGLRSLRRASADLRSVIDEPLRELREPIQEMRDEIYETVNRFGDDVVESVRDVGAEAKELPEGEPDEEHQLSEAEESEVEDGRRIASTDPFGVVEEAEQGLGSESLPSLLAAGAEPEVQQDAAAEEDAAAAATRKGEEA